MEGVIDYITRIWGSTCGLTDQNGVSRTFEIGKLTSNKIKVHDAVTFDLDGTTVSNIALLNKYQKGIVFSWA